MQLNAGTHNLEPATPCELRYVQIARQGNEFHRVARTIIVSELGIPSPSLDFASFTHFGQERRRPRIDAAHREQGTSRQFKTIAIQGLRAVTNTRRSLEQLRACLVRV
jgi:hypothetical protein